MCSETTHLPEEARRRGKSAARAKRKRERKPAAEPPSPGLPALDDLGERVRAVMGKAGPRATAAVRATLDRLKRHPEGSPEAKRAIEDLRQWIEKEEKRQPGLVIPLTAGDDPRQSSEARVEFHGHTLAGLVYTHIAREPVRQTLGEQDQALRDDLLETTVQHVRDTVEAMQPRDPIERQLIEQLVVQHARFLSLSRLAAQQSQLDPLVKVHEAADRAANTHRRMAAALAEYRNPRPVRAVQVIQQQNNAHQQVVQNRQCAGLEPQNATNEQGCPDGHSDAPALLPDTRGVGISTGGSAAREAVDAEYRPTDA